VIICHKTTKFKRYLTLEDSLEILRLQ